MSIRGSITLGELVGKLDLLEVACHRCDRRGRLSLEPLIAEHGPDTGLPDLWGTLAGDCPRAYAWSRSGPLGRVIAAEPRQNLR